MRLSSSYHVESAVRPGDFWRGLGSLRLVDVWGRLGYLANAHGMRSFLKQDATEERIGLQLFEVLLGKIGVPIRAGRDLKVQPKETNSAW